MVGGWIGGLDLEVRGAFTRGREREGVGRRSELGLGIPLLIRGHEQGWNDWVRGAFEEHDSCTVTVLHSEENQLHRLADLVYPHCPSTLRLPFRWV